MRTIRKKKKQLIDVKKINEKQNTKECRWNGLLKSQTFSYRYITRRTTERLPMEIYFHSPRHSP